MSRLSGFVFVLIAVLGGIAYAHGPEVGKNSKFQDRIEIITAWKMIEALNLDNPTAERVLEIRRQFTAKRKELQKSMDDDIIKLKTLLKEPAGKNEDELAATLADFRAKRIQIKDLWIGHYDEVSKVLTVRQQAQLVVFLRDFRKEVHGLMRPAHPAGNALDDSTNKHSSGSPAPNSPESPASK